MCSGVTHGRVFNDELYAQRFQKLIYLYLFGTEVLRTPSLTQPGFELMASRSWQYTSCHWDACSNHSVISDIRGALWTVRVMIPPESSEWANSTAKAACCKVATNLVDWDWELLLRMDYKPHPTCTTFTKLGYPVLSHIQVDVALSLAKKYSAINVKISQMTLQVILLWDDCHSECCQVLWFVKVLSVWYWSICLY